MRTLRILLAFLVRDLKNAASYRLQLFVQLASVLTLSFTFFFLSLMVSGVEQHIQALEQYGGQYFGFAMVGLAISSFVDASLRSFSFALRQSQLTGTMAAMLQTGCPLPLIVAGSALYPILLALARVGLFVLLAVGVFGVSMGQASPWPLLISSLLTFGVTLVLGVMAAGFVVRFKQGDPITSALSGLSWLVSGVVYPREILPGPIGAIAEFLPLTHCMHAVRLSLLQGSSWSETSPSLAYLALFCCLGAPVSFAWFYLCLRSAKRAGVLSHY